MSGLVRLAIAACMLYGFLHALPARAGGGRIVFSGAVVVPTCAASNEWTGVVGGMIPATRHISCGDHLHTKQNGAAASIYELSVVHLDSIKATGSPLLEYFDGYLADAHVDGAKMFTRTYQ